MAARLPIVAAVALALPAVDAGAARADDDGIVVQDLAYGEVLVFTQNILHGNRVNEEPETRWSSNCRFKSLLSPYADKKLGEFFEPVAIRPATRLGLRYRLPELPGD